MTRTRIGFLMLGCVLGVEGGRASAQPSAPEVDGALDRAPISLVEAIDKALAKDERTRFVAAELETGDPPAYRVQLLLADTLRTVLVDARDGRLRKPDHGELEKVEPKRLTELHRALDQARVTPQRAIQTAGRATRNGRAYRIELQAAAARALYDVYVLTGSDLSVVEIDAVEGHVNKAEPLRPAGAGVSFSFDRDALGQVPPGWSVRQTRPSQPARWAVVADRTASSPPNAFAVTPAQGDEYTFNLALAEATAYRNVELVVNAKAVAGEQDQGGGVVWRCADENNYYVCRFNPLESNFRVYKVVQGRRNQLQSASVPTQAGRWYTLRVTMVGQLITCYLDGRKYLEVEDGTFPEPGMVGLWTKADAATVFDDLVVRSLSAPPPATQGSPREP